MAEAGGSPCGGPSPTISGKHWPQSRRRICWCGCATASGSAKQCSPWTGTGRHRAKHTRTFSREGNPPLPLLLFASREASSKNKGGLPSRSEDSQATSTRQPIGPSQLPVVRVGSGFMFCWRCCSSACRAIWLIMACTAAPINVVRLAAAQSREERGASTAPWNSGIT